MGNCHIVVLSYVGLDKEKHQVLSNCFNVLAIHFHKPVPNFLTPDATIIEDIVFENI